MSQRLNSASSYLGYYLPPILWAVIIFVTSSVPAERVVSKDVLSYDKLIHVGVYFVLGFLVERALSFEGTWTWFRSRAPLVTVLIVVLYGASDELHQYLVPGRSVSVLDWAGDAVGGILSVLIFALLQRIRKS